MTRLRAPRSRAWTALAALVGSCAVSLAVGTAAPAAAAEEVVERPADGVFAVEGHGWGHGRGMSQWGAQGAASQGIDAERILSAYYPGTTRAVLPSAPIRVLLSGDEGVDTEVVAAPGLTVTDLATGTSAPLPAGPDRWRVVVDDAGLHLQARSGTAWTPYALGGATAHAGPVRLSGPELVRVAYRDGTSRDYRGAVQAVRASATRLQSVVVLPLEDYLLGVVPRESSSSWHAEALQAQAIAARSYSANKRARVAGGGTYDICDTTACQVFGGSAVHSASGVRTGLEPATTTAAVRATAGVVRTWGGTPIFAEFSSSNGGWSTTGDFPYLRAAADPWDGALPNSVHAWRGTLRASDLERRFPAVGTLRRVRVTARDGNGAWGGRVRTVVLEGVSSSGAPTSVTTTGAGVYAARSWPGVSDGLKSSWWRLTGASAPSTPPPTNPVPPAPAPPVPGPPSATLLSATAAPTLVRPPGASTGTLTATFRNSGSVAWPTAGLHLALTAPALAADPLTPATTRVANAVRTGATTVEPGETAVLTRLLDAARVAPGTHVRTYRLRVGTGPVFGPPVTWRVSVQAPRFTATAGVPTAGPAAQVPGGAGAPPAVFADGRTVVLPRRGSTEVLLPVRSTSNVVWPVGPTSPLQLGTSGPRDRTSPSRGPGWLSGTRATRLLEAVDGGTSVGWGSTGVLRLVLHGGGRPVGVTREAFEPVWAGRGWVTGAARALDVVRVDPAVPRLAGPHTAPARAVRLSASARGRTTLVVRLRNLGGAPWPVGAERLGASAPYALSTGWTSPSRPPALARNAHRPGAPAVFPGEVGEWRIPLSAAGERPGTYPLRLQALHGAGRYGPVLATTVTVVR